MTKSMAAELEAGLWVLISLLAQPLAAIVWPRIRAKSGDWSEAIETAAPWLHAVGPLYLSLMTGAVLGSQLGLYGFGLKGSLLGGLLGAVILAGIVWARRVLPDRIRLPMPPTYGKAFQAELRWAFYRGAAVSWLRFRWLGGLAGFGLAGLEWALDMQPWRDAAWRDPQQWGHLVRAGISAVLYGLSGNLWLVLAAQILTVMVWRLEPAAADPESGSND